MAFKFSAFPGYDPLPEMNFVQQGTGYEILAAHEAIPGTVEWRKHDKRLSLVLHLGGNINAIETEFDGRAVRLDPPLAGEIWLIPANSDYVSNAYGESASYIDIVLDDCLFDHFDTKIEIMPVAGDFDNVLLENIGALCDLLPKKDDVSLIKREEIINNIVARIADKFSRKVSPKTWRNVSFSKHVKACLDDLLQECLSEPLSLERLCSVTGEDPHSFLWAFRNAYGRTPAQYIIDQRLRRARHLLQTTVHDITTIAMETGFADHSHLSATFKKRIGLSPTEFRRDYK